MINHIPENYKFSHEYALFLNDILVEILKHGMGGGRVAAAIELADAGHAEALVKVPDDRKWDWLEENGYSSVLSGVAYKRIFAALLSDFCHFVFEALSCSRKGKLTVAFSLLRKPFKDNLFYFEWMLADPDDFIKSFMHEGPSKMENYRRTPALRFPIIEKAVSRTSRPAMFDAKHIDEIRYDRTRAYGFAAPWDQANHLLTTFVALQTSPRSFNFIFLDPQDETFWDFLYTQLPMLLYYAVEVVESSIARLLPDPELMRDITTNRRELGFQLWLDSLKKVELTEERKAIELPGCPQCGVPVMLDKDNTMLFFTDLKCKCQYCGLIIDASK